MSQPRIVSMIGTKSGHPTYCITEDGRMWVLKADIGLGYRRHLAAFLFVEPFKHAAPTRGDGSREGQDGNE